MKEFKVGDSVRVKSGVVDPDMEQTSIAGWQGRIVELINEGKEKMINIRWDSITLKNMPDEMIKHCNKEGWEYSHMVLAVTEVERVKPRDREQEVDTLTEKIEREHSWDCLADQGARIKQVLHGVDELDEIAVLQAWENFLGDKLTFPFAAKVVEGQERGRIRINDRVTVKGMSIMDDLYGLIVEIRHKNRQCEFPLCDLEVVDKKSANYLPVRDYCVWFANR